jgi:3-dehydroquinate synthase
LYEIIKAGVIADAPLFRIFAEHRDEVLGQSPEILDRLIAEAVRIKAEVVSADEKESGLRRILNFGHTFGHALEAETSYTRVLHGEAVSWGMRAATYLAGNTGLLSPADTAAIVDVLDRYGPIPTLSGISGEALRGRLVKDKKTIQKKVHFVLPVRIGGVTVTADIAPAAVEAAIERALAECSAS